MKFKPFTTSQVLPCVCVSHLHPRAQKLFHHIYDPYQMCKMEWHDYAERLSDIFMLHTRVRYAMAALRQPRALVITSIWCDNANGVKSWSLLARRTSIWPYTRCRFVYQFLGSAGGLYSIGILEMYTYLRRVYVAFVAWSAGGNGAVMRRVGAI